MGSTTLTNGGQAVTTGSVVISLNSGGVVVSSLPPSNAAQSAPNALGSYIASGIGLAQAPTAAPGVTTYAFNSQPAALGAVVSIGNRPASTLSMSNGNLVVGSQTVTSGSPAAIINGQTFSVGSNGIVIGSSTYAVSSLPSSAASGAVITIGSNTYTASASGNNAVVIGSQTITAGGSATINGQIVSVGSSAVVVGSSSTVAISALPSSPTISGAIFTISGSTYTDIANAPLTIGSITLSVGGPAATINNELVSAASSGIVIDGSTQSFSAIPSPSPASQAVFTIGSTLYTETAGSDLVIGTQTLSPGGPAATVGSQVISLASNGVVIEPASTSSTSNSVITTISTFGPRTTSGAVFAVDHSTFTEIEGSSLVIGSYTLSAGGPGVTIGGEFISVGSSGIVLGSSTVPYSALPTGSATASRNEGSVVVPKMWSLWIWLVGIVVWFGN